MTTPARKKPGPKGPRLAPDERTRPFSVRLTDARIETLKLLGVSAWLEPLLDRERRRMERASQQPRNDVSNASNG